MATSNFSYQLISQLINHLAYACFVWAVVQNLKIFKIKQRKAAYDLLGEAVNMSGIIFILLFWTYYYIIYYF